MTTILVFPIRVPPDASHTSDDRVWRVQRHVWVSYPWILSHVAPESEPGAVRRAA